MITGNAAALLAEKGYTCDISPPSIIRGSNVKISTVNTPALVVPITLGEFGDLEINVAAANGYRARIRNHGHSCFLCEIVIRSQFHTTYEPEA
jgi:Predicted inhibitor of MCP methylation, homolog of CheC